MFKHTQRIRRLIADEMSVFDHFVKLAIKGLIHYTPTLIHKSIYVITNNISIHIKPSVIYHRVQSKQYLVLSKISFQVAFNIT